MVSLWIPVSNVILLRQLAGGIKVAWVSIPSQHLVWARSHVQAITRPGQQWFRTSPALSWHVVPRTLRIKDLHPLGFQVILADVVFYSNYTFIQVLGEGNTGECSSEVPAGRVITYAIRDQQQAWVTTSTSYRTATQAWGIHIDGYNIAPQTTFSSTASTSATSSSTSPTLATSSTVGNPPATITPQPSSGLSAGAKAGIGVSVAFSALALGALIAFIFTQRKRKRITEGGEPASNLKDDNTSPVMVQKRMHELEGRGLNELDSRGISESEGREIPAEIDSAH